MEESTDVVTHWCHECRGPTCVRRDGEEVVCQDCGSFCVEEYEDDYDENDRPEDFLGPAPAQGTGARTENMDASGDNVTSNEEFVNQLLSQLFGMAGGGPGQQGGPGGREGPRPINASNIFSATNSNERQQGGFGVAGGRPIDVRFGNGSTIAAVLPFPIANGGTATLGDYAFGNIGAIINQLMMNDPGQRGPPPASKDIVTSLPVVQITQDHIDEGMECSVCKDHFTLDEKAKKLPCEHLFHDPCILPWLDKHNSCPVCRHELPTDDPDYEAQRNAQNNMSNS